MKILVLGGSGMLGSDVAAELVRRGHQVAAPLSSNFNITDPMSAAEIAMHPGSYDWCINCAAYTAVDLAENEIQKATEINALAPGYLSNACGMAGTKFVHFSTDFVFDGQATSPYAEDAPTKPLGVYGRSKRDGELAVLSGNPNSIVIRTSWLYGPNGKCFPKTMIKAWEAGKKLRVVSDQIGCPTYTGDLARVLADMIQLNAYPGVYHACGPTVTTWYAFARQAIEASNTLKGRHDAVEIEAIPTEAYPTPATRPKYSVLACDRLYALGIEPMRQLAEALDDFLTRL